MRLAKLDLNLLVVLDILLKERSVSRTADILALTQPGVSNALARLRAHFEDELLIQVGRRMAPTPFAESLAEPVHNALQEIGRIALQRSEFDPATASRTFKIICSDYAFQVFVTKAIRQLAADAPGIRLTTLLTTEQAGDILHQGLVDFVVLPAARAGHEHPSAPLFSEGFACIAWSENPLTQEPVTRERYLELEHVSTCLGLSNVAHVEQESLDAQGIHRNIVAYAPNFTSVGETIVGTPYIATVHARLAELYAQRLPIRVFPPPVEIAPFVEVLQWHKKSGADPGLMWMRDYLVKCASTV